MKIIITGSLGNISHPLTKELVQKGHTVTVISSNPEKQKDIEAIGAVAAIGSLEDVGFLTTTFTGADVAYCMIPPAGFANPDRIAYYQEIAGNYVQAIQQSGVKRVIHLSSFGADLDKGTGIILGAHHAEVMLNKLADVALTHMRPTYFYYNLYNFAEMIKNAGAMIANYGEDKIPLVSPIDIAAAIADEIIHPSGRKIVYVASDERTGNEIASILGAATGKPDLKWVITTDEQIQSGMEAHGIPPILATNLVAMYASLRSGAMSAEYYRNKPVSGKIKLEDFAKEFAAAFK